MSGLTWQHALHKRVARFLMDCVWFFVHLQTTKRKRGYIRNKLSLKKGKKLQKKFL